ncbi:Peptidase S13, D-Ala-D-Ala carboxypeptidase C [Trichormus variabilis ATCC 29413]|uniref:Peptidase S13, D-Ala-D-Ala carboxypeptidase C n=2 Tax=Anabaena variabilis TaxID=264691 RepID=Q3MFE3_TRIV2|nr:MULTISPECIES: D-alanyl-D-alanine carboxypeptidase/D-alanyl-D-alanine-endopeptidase [Nostocaceae]ABA20293.1 Peptidase S13, D-Ala-D-Ala carboxypeptidase C [Trichormus variabilis ATCC 29413]MBC1212729.1 D-alanyl-D-alanine carboxypeptidase/D-alanyl-D-alanine-endopeptidase [Trichormus variabilis ARAD]MBC1257110.1 D-alanyl-D-alanine carboxypeptidase/D-alanyl-D-alanine-endopeptidase [Trichormus variabilis V5]MBC1265830.1 D-alanyl-D-alanine carboxypeptidase/D-alanyl-D-alanine-endopeptidase [Trichorm
MPRKISFGLMALFISVQVSVTQQLVKAQTPTAPTPTTKSICPGELGTAIDTIVNRPLFNRVRWGILVKPLSSVQTLYSRDAQKYFTPASNAKLLTTAAALQQLGADFRIRTSIYENANGNFTIVGRGDPSLSDTQLQALAEQLKQKGITQIRQLIADDTYVQGDIVNSTWQWEDVQSDYGAPVNSFILNQNVFGLKLTPQTVGKTPQLSWNDPNEGRQWLVINKSVTVAANQPSYIEVTRDLTGKVLRIQGQVAANSTPYLAELPVVDPNYYFLRRLRTIFTTAKINLGTTLVASSTNNQQEVAAVQSPPLSQLLFETNQNSNNLYAEALLRALAFKQPRVQNKSTANIGLDVIKVTLDKLGVDPTGYVLIDASGLSRRNLVTPEALVQTLQGIAKTPAANVYRASLPIAGKSGTLSNRLRNTPAEGIVQAKTGTLSGAISLSGYVNSPQYEPLAFSIMVNQSEQPASALRQAIDEIVVLLAQIKRC